MIKHTKVQGTLLLNVVVREGTTVLKLFPCENQTLLVRRDALLILNLRLDIINRIRRLDLESNRRPGEGLDKDLHASAETKDEMKGRLLLDVIVRKSPTVFELLASKDEALLVRRNAFLVLDLRLDIVNSVGGLDFERDGLARQGLNEDLHTTTETKHYEKHRENEFEA